MGTQFRAIDPPCRSISATGSPLSGLKLNSTKNKSPILLWDSACTISANCSFMSRGLGKSVLLPSMLLNWSLQPVTPYTQKVQGPLTSRLMHWTKRCTGHEIAEGQSGAGAWGCAICHGRIRLVKLFSLSPRLNQHLTLAVRSKPTTRKDLVFLELGCSTFQYFAGALVLFKCQFMQRYGTSGLNYRLVS